MRPQKLQFFKKEICIKNMVSKTSPYDMSNHAHPLQFDFFFAGPQIHIQLGLIFFPFSGASGERIFKEYDPRKYL